MLVLLRPAFGQGVDNILLTTNVVVPNAAGGSDLLQLLDGSSLHGQLRAIDAAAGIRWTHPDARGPIELKSPNLDRIQFKDAKPVVTSFNPAWQFRFRNGDDISGNLAGLDSEALSLDTWFGKGFKVPRSAVESITFQARSVLYEGPTGLDGWTTGKSAQPWQYRDGAFVAQGSCIIGRDFGLTASASVEFDLSWVGPFNLMIPFYTTAIDRLDYTTSTYVLHIGRNQFGATGVAVQRIMAGGGGGTTMSMLGNQKPIPQLAQRAEARIEIRANKEDATFEVLADGELVGRWKDEKGFVAKGSGVVFFSQLTGVSLSISNLKVSETKGKLAAGKSEAPATDTLYLANRDEVTGNLRGLRDGKLAFATTQTELAIPLERVTQIFLGGTNTNAVARSPWEARVALAGGGTISFALEKWDERQVAGRSASFGPVAFSSRAVRQMEFNLDQPRSQDQSIDGEGSWSPNDRAGSRTSLRAPSQLLFRNGDILHGSLDLIDSTEGIRWQRPDVLQTIELKPDTISEIRFTASPPARSTATNACLVRLITGDQLEGSVVSIDAEKILLEAEVAGRLSVPRAMTELILPQKSRSARIFAGPTGQEGWVSGKISTIPDPGEWKYSQGAFYATRAASIARDLKLPDEASIQFDLTWTGMLQEAIALYTGYMQPVNLANKDNEPDFGGFYSLRLGSGGTEMYSVVKSAPVKNFDPTPTPVPAFNQKNQAHVEIRASKPKKLIALLVDGALVKQWTDAEFIGTGTGVRVVHQGLGAIKWSNLLVTDWDGQFEEAPTALADRKQDIAKLRNGDKVRGNLEAMRNGKITMFSAGSKLDIPLERVKQIEMAAKNLGPIPGEAANVSASLRNRQNVAFRLERWDKQGVTGSHPILGRLKFDPAAFERIQFIGKPGTNNSAAKEN